MKNKFLFDFFVKTAKLFNPSFVKYDDGELKVLNAKDKVDVFQAYSEIINDKIDCCEKIMNILKDKNMKEHDEYSFQVRRNNYLDMKRLKLDLQVEYYAKQDFVGHYRNRIKFYQEYTKELTEKAQQEMPAIAKDFERMIQFIPDGTKEKALTIGYLNRLTNQKHTVQTRNTLYREMSDWLTIIKKFEPKNG